MSFDPERAAAWIAERLAAGAPETRIEDLQLAGGVLAGDPAALAALDGLLPGIVGPAVVRLGIAAPDVEELVQRVRVAMVVPNATGKPALAGYTGRGPLHAYVRAVAVRLALKKLERDTPVAAEGQTALLALVPDDHDTPALELLKNRCREDVRAAFAMALAELAPRDRTLLRQHYVDGLTIDQLAPLHRIHRSTCARRLETVRAQILVSLETHVRDALGLDDGDLASILALIRSQLDLSLSRLLATQAGQG